MAKFPIDLTYYDRTVQIVRKNDNTGFPVFPEEENFLGLMKCGDNHLYYFKTKKNGHFVELDEVGKSYTWVVCHLVIPDFFSKVDIDIHTPSNGDPPTIIYLDEGKKLSRTFNGLFALAINQQLTKEIKAHTIDGLLKTGQYSCAIPGNNEDQSNNMDQMFFKFRKHYFMPIIISNGVTVYYAFEKEEIIDEWIKKAALAEKENHVIAVDAPIYYDNAFGIFITKLARLIEPGEA